MQNYNNSQPIQSNPVDINAHINALNVQKNGIEAKINDCNIRMKQYVEQIKTNPALAKINKLKAQTVLFNKLIGI